MVLRTLSLFAKAKRTTRRYLKSNFRDSLKVLVTGGCGGHGLPKFGGVGGQGGDVIAVGKENIGLHEVFRKNSSKIYKANSGKNSSHIFILGPPGNTLRFDVPVGVTVMTELGKRIGEINAEGEELLLAKGGTGGNQKNGFLGTKGQSYPVIFDLKLIADFGLVGFPNAGKSTFISRISHAKPKIASYPFTTVRPNLGIVKYKDFRELSIADLPGLIEGAYANRGMGHKFLKHVERTKVLLLIVDINGFQLSPQYPFRSFLETIFLLNKELELYNKDLLLKPAMLIVNKMDVKGATEYYDSIKHGLNNLTDLSDKCPPEMLPETLLKFTDIMAISAKESIDDMLMVKEKLRSRLDAIALMEQEENSPGETLYLDLREQLKEKGPKLV